MVIAFSSEGTTRHPRTQEQPEAPAGPSAAVVVPVDTRGGGDTGSQRRGIPPQEAPGHSPRSVWTNQAFEGSYGHGDH